VAKKRASKSQHRHHRKGLNRWGTAVTRYQEGHGDLGEEQNTMEITMVFPRLILVTALDMAMNSLG
jgi:hypothetical protein